MAIEITEEQAGKATDKRVQKFLKDLIVHFRVAQSRFMHEGIEDE